MPITGSPNRHALDAIEYAKACLAKDANECMWVKLTAVRFLRDLKKSRYVWDRDKVAAICNFVELMPHVKGRKWAGTKIKLEPWQKFQLGNVFGFIDPDTGMRRFKVSYEEVPRKNAKSTIAAAVANYMLLEDGEPGGENYTAATKRDQAKIVFGIAKKMAQGNVALREHYGVEINTHNMNHPQSGAILEPLSADSSTMDGLNISFICIDELHAHKTRDVFDVTETATGSREQPLTFIVTTAGSNRSGICYEQRVYLTKILKGIVEDDEYWGIIYTIDDGDDWKDPYIWEKANPNYGVSVLPDDIARLARKAMTMTSAQNQFLTKRLNVWVNADTAWMDMWAWDKCGDETMTMEQFDEWECIDAIDMATKTDFTSRMRIFWEENDEGQLELYVFARRWLPEVTIENDENDQYYGWNEEGWIEEIAGPIIDADDIIDAELEDSKIYDIKEVAYDPWQASYMAKKLSDQGFDMVEYRHTVQNMSEPMKTLQAIVLDGRLHHNGDPVLTWMVSNVVCHIDAKDNIYPRKETEANKIDDVIALIMAVGRLLVKDELQESVYKTRGIRTL